MTSSQPVRVPSETTVTDFTDDQPDSSTEEGQEVVAKETDAEDGAFGFCVARGSFTQPTKFEELIVGTQVPCTPGASQVCMYLS